MALHASDSTHGNARVCADASARNHDDLARLPHRVCNLLEEGLGVRLDMGGRHRGGGWASRWRLRESSSRGSESRSRSRSRSNGLLHCGGIDGERTDARPQPPAMGFFSRFMASKDRPGRGRSSRSVKGVDVGGRSLSRYDTRRAKSDGLRGSKLQDASCRAAVQTVARPRDGGMELSRFGS